MIFPVNSYTNPSNRLPTGVVVISFVAGYLLLAWGGQLAANRGWNLAVWNLAPPFGIYFLLRFRWGALPAVCSAIFFSTWLLGDRDSEFLSALMRALLQTAGYATIAWSFRKWLPDSDMFEDRRGLVIWSVIVILGALLLGLIDFVLVASDGMGQAQNPTDVLVGGWLTNAIGIYLTMPLLARLFDENLRRAFLRLWLELETWSYLGLSLVALWIAFFFDSEANYRYLLLLPVVWAASRQGMGGAVLSVTVLQIGLFAIGMLKMPDATLLFELQMRAFLLALVAFLIGIAVDDYRRAAANLRHTLRLAAAGEMAAALAHELNQPLTALTAYGAACKHLMKDVDENDRLYQVISSMLREADRAAAVVSRLRDFFRNGALRLETVSLGELIDAALESFRPISLQNRVKLSIGNFPREIFLKGDRVQLDVVLRNMLSNAFDAVTELPDEARWVALSVTLEGGNVVIEIADGGAGPDLSQVSQIFEPFVSTKSSGLGLGLAMSRAIAEAHGGSLSVHMVGHGCFRLSLPMETNEVKNDV